MTHHPCTTTIRRCLLTTTGPRRARLLAALDRLFEAHDRHDQNLERRAVHQLTGGSPADRLRPPRPASTPLPRPAPRPDRLRPGGAA